MKTEKITYFLKNGELINFPFGTLCDEIRADFAETKGLIIPLSRKDKRPALIKYERLEFYFNSSHKQKLIGVQLTYSQPDKKTRLEIDFEGFYPQLSLDATKELLRINKIGFKELVAESENESTEIVTEGNVTLYFSDHNRIQKIGRFVRE